MIDLNDAAYNISGGNIFNDSVAGIVEDVTLKEVNETDPTKGYEILFEKGGIIRQYINYFNEADPKSAPIMKAVGIQLKHMIQVLYGENQPLPKANNMHDLIVACMRLIGAKAGTKVRLHINYGLKTKPSTLMRLHKYSPFMELMTTPTKLRVDNRFVYERPAQPQAEASSGAGLEAASEDNPI